MITTQGELDRLREAQPRLHCINNTISGIFHVCATIDKPSQKDKPTIKYYTAGESPENDQYLVDEKFCIKAEWEYSNDFVVLTVCETDGKLISWKKHIPPEYWHVNLDGSFCLGTTDDLNQLQQQYHFSSYFYDVVSQFLYQITFVKKFGFEPWKSDRHGIFKAFELALEGKNNKNKLYSSLASDETNWRKLLFVVPGGRIKGGYRCPFCLLIPKLNNKQSKNCRFHKPQIEGFNRLKTFYSSKKFKHFCLSVNKNQGVLRDNPKNASVMKVAQ